VLAACSSSTSPVVSDAGADSAAQNVDAAAPVPDAAPVDASVDATPDTSTADAGDAGLRAIGATCTSDKECASGLCLDVSTVDDGAKGMYCTIPCTKVADCSALVTPDCDNSPRGQVCLSAEWFP
jgi:hypothetical protein